MKDNTEDVPVKIKEVPPPVVKPVVQKEYSPIPVKINNSDILMEGKVRSYIADNRTWQDVTLKLTADGELTKNNQVKLIKNIDTRNRITINFCKQNPAVGTFSF